MDVIGAFFQFAFFGFPDSGQSGLIGFFLSLLFYLSLLHLKDQTPFV
jgi:hypothetical protein